MRIAITGGTGFVGRHLASKLAADGHDVVLIARGVGPCDEATLALPNVRWVRTGVGNADGLQRAFAGCDAVAHCAGINRELGRQTYRAVHVDGTRNVVESARAAGVGKIAMLR